MRRKEGTLIGLGALAICAAVLVAWAVVPAIGGKERRSGPYRGKVIEAEKAKIRFAVRREDGGRIKVLGFTVRSVPLNCALGVEPGDYDVEDSIRIGPTFRFEYSDDSTGGRGGDAISLTGKLLPDGRARGSLEMQRLFDEIETCRSGILEWRARVVR